MITRRSLLLAAAPAFVRAAERPVATVVAAGDVGFDNALIWSRSDRPSRMLVRWATSESGPWRAVKGPACDAMTDFTSKLILKGLPEDQTVLYDVQYEVGNVLSEPVRGRLRTPSRAARDIRFTWSGDVVGQGYGINPDWGGLRGFEAVRQTQPDFFLHSGDTIYADGPLEAESRLADGTIWRNLVTPEKSKVAETLAEFRGAYKYNLMDGHFRRFLSEVPQVWQWDDHEVLNNWSSSTDLSANPRYQEKDIRVLSARAKQAFREYSPIPFDGGRIYRQLQYGPLLDVFVLDMRSYRGPNTHNRESEETPFLGPEQMKWFMRALKESKAVWKVIAADMPIGLLVPDGKDARGRARFEAIANGDGPPLGRELETARLLRFIKENRIRNTVWFTADVHYTAAHHYSPERAEFKDFDPFWEFVSGPLHAGSFGPGTLENTFGPELAFAKHPPKGQSNLPPSAGLQFFGDVHIDAEDRAMRVVLRDISGAALFAKELEPVLT
jgi:alkaline phosphatase D